MNEMLLIDLETQSFPVETGIYEVACLVVENYEIVDKLYLGKEILGYNGSKKYGFGFHDISTDEEYIKKFKGFIDKYPYPIVAHNCPFDRKFLVYYNWIKEDYPTYCSMRAIRFTDSSLKSYALRNLVQHYKVAKTVDHTAMSDIENVYKILNILRPQKWLPVGTKLKSISHNKNNPRELDNIDLDIETTDILNGEVVCFTGKSDYPRNTMEEIAIKNGAVISNGITTKTTMLVVGIDAGSKLDKAQVKGISIISDEEYMKILNLLGKNISAYVIYIRYQVPRKVDIESFNHVLLRSCGLTLATQERANQSNELADQLLQFVSTERRKLGAQQNRFGPQVDHRWTTGTGTSVHYIKELGLSIIGFTIGLGYTVTSRVLSNDMTATYGGKTNTKKTLALGLASYLKAENSSQTYVSMFFC